MTSELVKELLEAGVHFGHQTKRWNPKMRRFIFGERSDMYIIDLEQTERALLNATTFLTELTSRGERILFLGTKRQAQETMRSEATRAEMFYVVNRWLGGTLTNFQTIRASVGRLRELRGLRDSGALERRSKQEAAQLAKALARLEYNLEGIVEMERLPQALFIVDPHREAIAVHEANRLGIPTVAICDTNCDPDLITYVIPGNDDATRAIKLLTTKIADACVAGRDRLRAVQPVPPSADTSEDTPVVDTPASVVTLETLEAVVPIPPLVDTLDRGTKIQPPKVKRTRMRATKRTTPSARE